MSAEMGWSQTEVSLGYSIMMAIYAVVAYVSGFIVDKWGTRPLYVVGAVLGMLGFWGMAQTHSLYGYYAVFCILAGVSTTGLWTGSIVSSCKWFVGESYARMWGIAFSGGSIAQIVLSLFVKHYLASGAVDAWCGAMELLGFLTLALLAPAAVLVKQASETYGMKPSGHVPDAGKDAREPATRSGAYSSYAFWAVVAVFAFCTLGEFQIWSQLVSY